MIGPLVRSLLFPSDNAKKGMGHHAISQASIDQRLAVPTIRCKHGGFSSVAPDNRADIDSVRSRAAWAPGRPSLPGRPTPRPRTDCRRAASAATASATAEDAGLSEITVTAERFTSTIQSTPISISALSGDQLTAAGLTACPGHRARKCPACPCATRGPA